MEDSQSHLPTPNRRRRETGFCEIQNTSSVPTTIRSPPTKYFQKPGEQPNPYAQSRVEMQTAQQAARGMRNLSLGEGRAGDKRPTSSPATMKLMETRWVSRARWMW
jgi:hypothetical protein